jgi:hypothetical protein
MHHCVRAIQLGAGLSHYSATPIVHYSSFGCLHIKEHRLVIALEANIETIDGFVIAVFASGN